MANRKKRNTVRLTDNDGINQLLSNVVSSVKDFTEEQLKKIKSLTQIGEALSAEHDIDRLLRNDYRGSQEVYQCRWRDSLYYE